MGAGNRIERLSLHYERSVLPLHHPAIKFILSKHYLNIFYLKCQL